MVLEDAQAKQTQEISIRPYVKDLVTNLDVKFVPSDLTDEQLTEIFAQFGNVVRWGGAPYPKP